MIAMYCHDHHHASDGLCAECRELLDHAHRKIDTCPFHEAKPVCANCRIHCYTGDMRERVRTVMRYAGPRMLLRHPKLAILHIADRMNKPKEKISG